MLTTYSKKLLRKVAAHIVKYPKSFDMDTFGRFCSRRASTPCGTVGCIATTVVEIAGIDTHSFLRDNDTD